MKYTPKIEKALKVAAVCHRNQLRKSDEAIPYIIHPFAVAIILSNYTDDENTIVAGLLHDTIEDSEYTPEELTRDFGPDVCEIVMGVTEKKSDGKEKLPWKVRKDAYIENLENDRVESLMVCAADKIHNMRNLLDDKKLVGEEAGKNFNSTPEERLWYHEEILRVLKTKLDSNIIDEYERLLTETRKSKM